MTEVHRLPPPYQVALTFNPDQVNRFRSGQLGVWRVTNCYELFQGLTGIKHRIPIEYGDGILFVPTVKHYRNGVIVNPFKLLKEYQSNVKINDHDRG